MITREMLSEIVAFNADQHFTTTLYLRIDGSPQQTHLIRLKDLIKERKQELKGQNLSPEVIKSVNSDFKRIQEFVNLKFSREGAKTLIIFSCSARKFWKVLTLNIPFRSQLIVNSRPQYRQLALILDDYSRFLIVLLERAKARLFEVYAGEILEHSDILDEVPAKVRMGGYAGYEERKIERHIDDHIRRHFKHVADAAYDLFQKYSNDYIILGGLEQNTRDFQQYLHSTLSEKVVATIHEDLNVSPTTILERTMQIDRELRILEERRLLNRFFNEVNSGGLGITGIDSTIRALQQGQVNYLLVQDGFGRDGYRCVDCMSLHTSNGACDYCGGKTKNIGDIVEEAIHDALQQGCQVRYVTLPDSQLTSAGNIGAVLRFKT